ncbi:MAG: hypothetical protein JXL80_03215 [Planctomycetes bacterium]|nr:hypothetical protein [Planctomycetota bacterium]
MTTDYKLWLFLVLAVCVNAVPVWATDWTANADEENTDPRYATGVSDGHYIYDTRSFGTYYIGNYANHAYARVRLDAWNGLYVHDDNDQTKDVQTSWKKSYSTDDENPEDTSFVASGTLTLGWWLDGDANNGLFTAAMALTHSQASITINSYPGTDGDMYFDGDWSIQLREGGTLTAGLNISWPPGFTIGYTSGDDVWTCGQDTKNRPFEMDFGSDNETTVYTNVINFAKAHSQYDTRAWHAYSMGYAFLSTNFSLSVGP